MSAFSLTLNDFGGILLLAALLFSAAAIVVASLSQFSKKSGLVEVARVFTITSCLSCLTSLLVLADLFLSSDFSNQYVWQFSNRAMPSIYKFTAIWGGMDGSMLLWCAFLCVSILLAQRSFYSFPRKTRAWFLVFLNIPSVFFLFVVTVLTNPFRYLQSHALPFDGNGLNPLLQNPYMAIHPPTLYVGFVTLAIPFAILMAGLAAREQSVSIFRLTRLWALVSWSFLTAGICLGGYWAYIELGWGGFWAWDPVENASLFPWLALTAFLHSVIVQERKGLLKVWNVWLIVLSFGLTVFGTFLTRSGIVQSVHAFASTDIGWVFLVFLSFLFLLTVFLTWRGRALLKSEGSIESPTSREAIFLVNNLILLSILFATVWGVMFPVFSEAVTGTRQTVSIPFFNAVNIPLFLVLLFFMGLGPLLSWRKTNWSQLRKIFVPSALFGFCCGALLLFIGIRGFWPISTYAICGFVACSILLEVHRAMRAQRATHGGSSLTKLARRHPSRYGGHIVHLGVVIVALGITASMAHKTEREFALAPGETFKIHDISLTLLEFHEFKNDNYEALRAALELKTAGSSNTAVLLPELRFYFRNAETTSEVKIDSSWKRDIYVVLAGVNETGTKATFKLYINPLQFLLWIGVLIMVFGSLSIVLLQYFSLLEQRSTKQSEEALPIS